MNIAISPAVAFYWNVIQLSYAEYSKNVLDLSLILKYQNLSPHIASKVENAWNCVIYQFCTYISIFSDNICPQIVFQLAATLSFQLLMKHGCVNVFKLFYINLTVAKSKISSKVIEHDRSWESSFLQQIRNQSVRVYQDKK